MCVCVCECVTCMCVCVCVCGSQSNREFFAYLPEDADELVGPFAIRWRNYKAHYYTAG